MVETRYKIKVVNPVKDPETTQNELNLGSFVSFSAQEREVLMAIYRKSPETITYDEISYAFSFFIPDMVENVYHYNVKIEPKRSEKLLERVLLKFNENNFPSINIALDGVQFAYAPQRLDTTKLQCKTKIVYPKSKQEREFTVTIQEETDCEIPMKQALKDYLNSPRNAEPTQAIRAFTVILKADLSQSEHAPIFSSFFLLPGILRGHWTYCFKLWQTFKSKKLMKDEEVDLEDILAQDLASTPNAEYIRENLYRMKMVDFLDAAEKNPKFQEIAKKYFPHTTLFIYCFSEDKPMPFDRLSSYLSIFGHLIKRICWRKGKRNMDEKYFKMIAKFCGKTLIKFEIDGRYFNFNKLSQFQALEDLSISNVQLSELGSIPSLKCFILKWVKLMNFDGLSRTFPKLECMNFCIVDGLEDEMIIDFQRCNPQLQTFIITDGDRDGLITSSIFKDIGIRTPNIEKLSYSAGFRNDDELEVNAVHLSGLQKLKYLELRGVPLFSTKPLIESLVNNAIPIEHLDIIENNSCDLIENLPKLKQLKNASISECSQEVLMNFIKEAPHLEEIHIGNLMEANVPGLLQLLESSHNINLTLSMNELSINLNEYNSMLTLVKDHHLKVVLYFNDADIYVPDDILEANRNSLDICWSSSVE